MRQTRRDWDSIRGAYLQSNLSLRELAVKHGVSFSTLGKRAVREQWAQRRERLGNSVATRVEASALQAAEEQGRELGLTAAGLVQRSQQETARWLDRVETVAAEKPLDADKLNKVVTAWRGVIETGREAFGLGHNMQPPAIRIGVLAQVTIQPATAPESPASLPESTLPELTEGSEPE